jgi:hypothetical protein
MFFRSLPTAEHQTVVWTVDFNGAHCCENVEVSLIIWLFHFLSRKSQSIFWAAGLLWCDVRGLSGFSNVLFFL